MSSLRPSVALFYPAALALVRLCWTASLFTVLVLCLISVAAGQGFSGMVIFGDSISDPGNHFMKFGTTAHQPFQPVPDSSYAIGGHHFTNGATWAEQVAAALRMANSGGPALRAHGIFTNYAMGRARARQCNAVPAACAGGEYPLGVVDLSFEVSRFLTDFAGSAPVGNLYVMEIGGNDLQDALFALQTDNSGVTSVAIIQNAVLAEAGNIQALYAAGARNFLVLTAPNLGFTPFVQSLGQPALTLAAQFAAAYNGGLSQALTALSAQPGISFISFDFNALIAQIELQPGAYGISDAVDPCLNFGVMGQAICAMPNKHLFWDGIHPTTVGHGLIATAVLQALGVQ